MTEFCEAVQRMLAEPRAFAERLHHFIDAQFAGIETDPDLAMVLLLETRHSARFYGEPVRAVLRRYAGAVDELLRSGVAEGSVRSDVSIPLARRMLIGSLEEIELDWLLGPRLRPLRPLAGEIARSFHLGIGAGAHG